MRAIPSIALALFLAGSAAAQAPPSAPAPATPPPPSAPATPPSAIPPIPAPLQVPPAAPHARHRAPGIQHWATDAEAEKHCQNSAVVRVDLGRHAYYFAGERSFYRHRHAAYTCSDLAQKAGLHHR